MTGSMWLALGMPLLKRRLGYRGWIAGWLLSLLFGAQAAGASLPVRVVPLVAAGTMPAGFTRQPAALTGLSFTNQLSEVMALNNQILENGAGVALGDVDGDGRCDVYLCGAESGNRLYRNLGDWKFAEVTQLAGVGCAGQLSTGAVLADVDGDGDLDLSVNGVGVGTRLFLNDGQGRFAEVAASGLPRTGAATSMALADLDGDGDLDLYVCRYRTTSVRGDDHPPEISARRVKGEWVVTPADRFFGVARSDGSLEIVEKGEPDGLYWNDGHGRFSAASWTNGTFMTADGERLTAAPEDWGLSVMLRDLNGDGWPDIYVCNDFFRSRDQLWLGDGRGRFRAASASVLRDFPLSSMAIDVADINRDGHDDFLVAEMLSRDHRTRRHQRANAPKLGQGLPVLDPEFQLEQARNVMQLARGDGTFADLAWLTGLAATDWTWSVAFLDVDLDGWEDLLVATGNAHDVLDLDAQEAIDRAGRRRQQPVLAYYPRLAQPNLAFRNNRDLTFSETGGAWGFDGVGVSQGMALADLDGDGDLDIVVNNLNAETWLYRNNSPAPRLTVRLQGQAPNTRGIGARITVAANPPVPGLPVQSQVIVAGGRYLGSDDSARTFAAGTATNLSVTVQWRSGRVTRLASAAPGTLCVLAEPAEVPSPIAVVGVAATNSGTRWFTNQSVRLAHDHRENVADEYARQPLLPYELGAGGPGVSWMDIDGDGWDDLIVGGSKGGRLGVFRNDTQGGFTRVAVRAVDGELERDTTTVLGWSTGSRPGGWLVGSANYEDGRTNGAAVLAFESATVAPREMVPAGLASPGPLALGDIDGDGDLDLFVGGRVVAGRWPAAAASQLLLNNRGVFEPDARNNPKMAALGLVSGAVFTDIDGDGDPDLVVACEWGAIRIFRNEHGRFTEWDPGVFVRHGRTSEPGTNGVALSMLTGIWNSITAGDFDGDGRMDLVAGNWGRNCREHFFGQPELWFGDFGGAGGGDVLEAIWDPAVQREVPWRARDGLMKSLPWVAEKYPTWRDLARASMTDLLAGRGEPAGRLKLATTDSMVFLNRTNGWEAIPLPGEAQYAPVFGLAVADFNGDGMEDVFLAQNFFRTEPETSRLDAGRGVVLAGQASGGFRAVPGQESGVIISGEQRGAAVADYDHDGRPDILVGQNSGPTQLWRNLVAPPGLRVRLWGPPGNPHAVGARMRLQFTDRWGPVREIHAGSGYWSQDSPVTVLARPSSPVALEVHWPGGGMQTIPIHVGVDSLDVSAEGAAGK